MICWFENHSNIIQLNATQVFFLSVISKDKHGLPIKEDNHRSCISLFIARSIPKHTWVNDPDVYLQPLKRIN
jgi:hypothetical protein